MDQKAFQAGYLMGRALSQVRPSSVHAATQGLLTALTQIILIDRELTKRLEILDQEAMRAFIEWYRDLPERLRRWPPRLYYYYSDVWDVIVGLPLGAEQVYQRALQHATKIHLSMDQSGLHEVILQLAKTPPAGYGEERERVPPDIRWLAESLGASDEEVIDLAGGELRPQDALESLAQEGGSRSVFGRFLAMPNPFAVFRRKLMSLREHVTPQVLGKLWPRRSGWGPALAGATLVGVDIISATEGILSMSSLGTVASAIQAIYSIPEGVARIRRGVEKMRAQQKESDAQG